MSIVIDHPNPANNLEESFDCNRELPLAFDFLEYEIGTKIARPKDFQKEQMCILAAGCIKVKIQSNLGESIIHVIQPGDMFKLSAIAGMSSSDMSTRSHFQTVFVADANTKIVRLKMIEIENIFKIDPRLAYSLVQDMMRRWYGALQSMSTRYKEIGEYLYNNPVNARG